MNGCELLVEIARKAMLEKGLATDFPPVVLNQLNKIHDPAKFQQEKMRDLRGLIWCSIDNDDSRDLDQLTAVQKNPNNGYTIFIAIADVDALVQKSSQIDRHAQINTTSVYTPCKIFPMLPEKLSTDLTSLNENQGRVSVIFEITLDESKDIVSSELYQGYVYNYAKLTYSGVGAWLEGHSSLPEAISLIPGLAESLQLQDELAQALRKQRHLLGALSFETIELKATFKDGNIDTLESIVKNRAHQLIENFMIAANTASARYAIKNQIPSLRRVVRVPERWERIVEMAQSLGDLLPSAPDSIALDVFLVRRKEMDPEAFPDLSLAIIKLLGSGEYIVEKPGEIAVGHFGLALRDYTHSTAPNRRYPDLITQRLIKASLNGNPLPYNVLELESLAQRCTECEDTTTKVERRVKKSAAALLLANQIGKSFDAIVTGASNKGTWVRLQSPPVEGKLLKNTSGLDVGDKIVVKLVNVNVMEGFIDFIVTH
ncbi:MAG: RNB domain-containing ribonuclease [Parachlamydiaceae bacterium]|nr:RNB domain-containing ribonuclease [Parachlamydiaceae bacterium]